MHTHQELHSQSEDRQICSQIEEQNIHSHHHGIEQPHQMEQQVRQSQRLRQSCLASSQDITKTCSNNSNDNQISNDNNNSERDSSDNNEEGSGKDRKKKGGKIKGTLETSVEIRNRMIGMSEAGLSTLSIALAINRSVSLEKKLKYRNYTKFVFFCRNEQLKGGWNVGTRREMFKQKREREEEE